MPHNATPFFAELVMGTWNVFLNTEHYFTVTFTSTFSPEAGVRVIV
jgi:hypothetical protein